MPANSEERMKILRMLEEGKLSADEAGKLLDALGSGAAPGMTGRKNQQIRVSVTGDQVPAVNVSVPIALAKTVLRFIPKQARDGDPSIDPTEIMRLIEEGYQGKIASVHKEDERLHVEIFVE